MRLEETLPKSRAETRPAGQERMTPWSLESTEWLLGDGVGPCVPGTDPLIPRKAGAPRPQDKGRCLRTLPVPGITKTLPSFVQPRKGTHTSVCSPMALSPPQVSSLRTPVCQTWGTSLSGRHGTGTDSGVPEGAQPVGTEGGSPLHWSLTRVSPA